MLSALLSRGYFPNELPPSFATVNYSNALTPATGGHAPPQSFDTASAGKLCPYSLARAGNFRFRRRLSIVNPIHYYNLSNCIANNWAVLSAHINRSGLSQSKPELDPTCPRAVRPAKSWRDLLPVRARNRSGSGATVVADISEFYHSIYTHSISWALHTKAVAKANVRARRIELGDQIDALIRKAQDNQTMGIPIGPDTSFIVSEVLLSSADTDLLARVRSLKGIRYFDDFEFSFPQSSEAEKTLAVLQEVLLAYELRLNPRKTSVRLPPMEFEATWVREVRAFHFRKSASGQAGDLIGYFDLITEYMTKRPDEHVAKYAVSRLVEDRFVPRPSNLILYQSLLCQIATAEPGSIREVLMSLIHVSSQRHALDIALISETLTSIIVRHAPLGNHYEVAWSIWAAITLGITLENAAQSAISKVDNSVVAILALDAKQQGLAAALDTALWEARMCEPELYEDQWLLSYEANMHAWLPSQGGGDHVSGEANFGFLKAAGVHFYESNVPIAMPGVWAPY